MSFEAESNSELTVIVPAYQLHFRFPVQNKIHKQTFLLDTQTGILDSIAGPCDFLPARSDGPTNFKKSALWKESLNIDGQQFTNINKMNNNISPWNVEHKTDDKVLAWDRHTNVV